MYSHEIETVHLDAGADLNNSTVFGQTYAQWNKKNSLDFLYGNALASVFGSFAVNLVTAVVLFSKVSPIPLFTWLFFTCLFFAVRLLLWKEYHRKEQSRTPWFWLNSYRVMSFAAGTLNGLAMWLFFDHISAEYQLLIFFSIVGLTAASSGTHGVDMPTFRLFMYPSCLLSVAKLLSCGQSSYVALSIMFIFYILVMGRIGRQTYSTLQQNFRLTHAMHYRATHDPLVGLLNREEFENQFEIRLPLTSHSVAMLFLDLDNFKPLNDTLGHQAGDRALKQVAEILLKAFRKDDIIARLGGDEFVVLLFLDDIEQAEKIAQRIQDDIKAISFPGQHDYPGLTASIGIAFSYANNVSFSQLMRIADSACYRSKEKGRNQISISCIQDH